MNKRKMLILSIIVVCAVAVILTIFLFIRSRLVVRSAGRPIIDNANNSDEVDSQSSVVLPDGVQIEGDLESESGMGNFDADGFENQETLIGLFDSERDAQKAAGQYGIILLSYEYGVAEFELQSWQDADEIIQLGIDNGWVQLSTSEKRELY